MRAERVDSKGHASSSGGPADGLVQTARRQAEQHSGCATIDVACRASQQVGMCAALVG